jgi:rod shape-determining protein MreB
MFGFLKNDVAIDLGTSTTLVFVRGKGISIHEPSVVAVESLPGGRREVVAVGHEAKDMLGRTPGSIQAIRPMKDGVIADFDACTEMLRHFLQQSLGRRMGKPRVIVCVPVGITEVEKRAVREAAESAGAREVFLIEEPMAAAIGAGMPITEPSGNMIVDVGGGTCEVAVISLGGIVYNRSIRVGGDKMDVAIVNHVKRKYSLLVGDRTAENIKIRVGNAYPDDEVLTMEVKGRDLVGGTPKSIEVTSDEIREAMHEPINQIVESVRIGLERTPPELASDIVDRGIVLTGGGCLLKNFDMLLKNETGLPVYVSEEPVTGAVIGAGTALEQIDLLEAVALAS